MGYTTRHLFQRIEEHRLQSYSMAEHVDSHHLAETPEMDSSFKILRKCCLKLDCLIFEMFFIKKLKLAHNKQSDSIMAKCLFKLTFILLLLSVLLFIF